VSEFGDFEYYAWDRYYNKNKSISTIANFFNSVSNLEEFVDQSDKVNCSADNVSKREAKLFKRWLTDKTEPHTASQYINILDNMCQYFLSDEYYPGNPFDGLADTIDASQTSSSSSSYQSNDRITVDDSKLREAIRSTHGSSKILLLAILIKTGVRMSEALNMDWEDVNIDHDLADDLLPESRFELSDHPDTIYIDADKTEETYQTANTSGNKRVEDSTIPIDAELKRLLTWHALTRVRRFDAENPVFMVNNKTQGMPSDRLGKYTAWSRVTTLAKEFGWWEPDRGEKRNVTPHWFRAKFSTYMTNRLEVALESDKGGFSADPDDIVKGMRGDTGEDVIEDYKLRKKDYFEYIRPRQFKIGLEGI
jgi:integrase